MDKAIERKSTRKRQARIPVSADPAATPPTPVEQQRPAGSASFGYAAIGWVLGAMSLLSLIDELELVKIQRHLQEWVRAYSALVGKLSDALFGWIDWRWLSVDREEAHVLVLCAIIGSAVGRAFVKEPPPDHIPPDSASYVGALTGIMLLAILPTLVLVIALPGELGRLGGGWWFLLFTTTAVFRGKRPKRMFPREAVIWKELIGIVALVLIAVAASRLFD